MTRREAEARARHIRSVTTRVHLDLTGGPRTFEASSEVTFEVAVDGPTFVDCTADKVHEVVLDRVTVSPAAVEPTRIVLPSLAPGPHTLHLRASMAYQHEGNGLHRFVDPSDDLVYLHSHSNRSTRTWCTPVSINPT